MTNCWTSCWQIWTPLEVWWAWQIPHVQVLRYCHHHHNYCWHCYLKEGNHFPNSQHPHQSFDYKFISSWFSSLSWSNETSILSSWDFFSPAIMIYNMCKESEAYILSKWMLMLLTNQKCVEFLSVWSRIGSLCITMQLWTTHSLCTTMKHEHLMACVQPCSCEQL